MKSVLFAITAFLLTSSPAAIGGENTALSVEGAFTQPHALSLEEHLEDEAIRDDAAHEGDGTASFHILDDAEAARLLVERPPEPFETGRFDAAMDDWQLVCGVRGETSQVYVPAAGGRAPEDWTRIFRTARTDQRPIAVRRAHDPFVGLLLRLVAHRHGIAFKDGLATQRSDLLQGKADLIVAPRSWIRDALVQRKVVPVLTLGRDRLNEAPDVPALGDEALRIDAKVPAPFAALFVRKDAAPDVIALGEAACRRAGADYLDRSQTWDELGFLERIAFSELPQRDAAGEQLSAPGQSDMNAVERMAQIFGKDAVPAYRTHCGTVEATAGWQTLDVPAGPVDRILVSGLWTVDKANYRTVSFNGHTGADGRALERWSQYKLAPGEAFGALLARTPDGKVAHTWDLIRKVNSAEQDRLVRFNPATAFRINDTALSDNRGTMTICIVYGR